MTERRSNQVSSYRTILSNEDIIVIFLFVKLTNNQSKGKTIVGLSRIVSNGMARQVFVLIPLRDGSTLTGDHRGLIQLNSSININFTNILKYFKALGSVIYFSILCPSPVAPVSASRNVNIL